MTEHIPIENLIGEDQVKRRKHLKMIMGFMTKLDITDDMLGPCVKYVHHQDVSLEKLKSTSLTPSNTYVQLLTFKPHTIRQQFDWKHVWKKETPLVNDTEMVIDGLYINKTNTHHVMVCENSYTIFTKKYKLTTYRAHFKRCAPDANLDEIVKECTRLYKIDIDVKRLDKVHITKYDFKNMNGQLVYDLRTCAQYNQLNDEYPVFCDEKSYFEYGYLFKLPEYYKQCDPQIIIIDNVICLTKDGKVYPHINFLVDGIFHKGVFHMNP
jgi:hypothetical protein